MINSTSQYINKYYNIRLDISVMLNWNISPQDPDIQLITRILTWLTEEAFISATLDASLPDHSSYNQATFIWNLPHQDLDIQLTTRILSWSTVKAFISATLDAPLPDHGSYN